MGIQSVRVFVGTWHGGEKLCTACGLTLSMPHLSSAIAEMIEATSLSAFKGIENSQLTFSAEGLGR